MMTHVDITTCTAIISQSHHLMGHYSLVDVYGRKMIYEDLHDMAENDVRRPT